MTQAMEAVTPDSEACCLFSDLSRSHNRHFAMFSLGGPDGYLDVLSEGSEEFHEAADGKAAVQLRISRDTWGCLIPRTLAAWAWVSPRSRTMR